MKFEEAVAVILDFEGGLVNNEHDSGGITKYGISKRSYPALDVASLSRAEAIDIYRRDFWQKLFIEQLPARLRLAFFDAAVNQGPGRATSMLQKLLGVKVDGVMGPKTIMALGFDGGAYLDSYLLARHDTYARSTAWLYFGKGWSRRLLEVALISLERG